MKSAFTKTIFPLLILSLGLAGLWLIFYTTRWGIGLFGWDSFNYIAGARNLAQGNGYVFPFQDDRLAPITHFPPGLSLILAGFEWFGVDALVAARGFNAVLFGLSVALAGLTIWNSTRSAVFSLLGAFLFLSSAVLVEIYSFAMSEGFYLFLTLLSFLLLDRALERKQNLPLIAAILVFAFAGVTRFIAVANVGASVFAYFLWSRKTFIRKTGEAALLGFAGLLPAIWWTVRTYALTESINDRQFGFHPPVEKNFLSATRTITTWFLPERFVAGYEALYGILLIITAMGTVLFALWYGFRKTGSSPGSDQATTRPRFINLLYGSYLLVYPAVLLGAKTFLDPDIGMSDRMLSPVLLAMIILGTGLLSSMWRSGIHSLRGLALVAVVYLIVFNLYFARYPIAEFHEKGLGLGRAEVQNSKAVQALPELIQEYPVYSNDPFTLYFYTGQVGYRINGFSPQELPSGLAILAIFGTGEDHPVYRRYADRLELLIDDPVASLYLYKGWAHFVGHANDL